MFNPSAALFANTMLMFRLMFFHNKKPAKAGFIMYMTGAAQSRGDVNNIRKAMKSAKIQGNFRNLFMYSPNGKKDSLKIIPQSEVAAKEEFLNIKNVSRDDMTAAYRALPQILGIIPIHTGGLGGVEKANELMPL